MCTSNSDGVLKGIHVSVLVCVCVCVCLCVGIPPKYLHALKPPSKDESEERVGVCVEVLFV